MELYRKNLEADSKKPKATEIMKYLMRITEMTGENHVSNTWEPSSSTAE